MASLFKDPSHHFFLRSTTLYNSLQVSHYLAGIQKIKPVAALGSLLATKDFQFFFLQKMKNLPEISKANTFSVVLCYEEFKCMLTSLVKKGRDYFLYKSRNQSEQRKGNTVER